MLMKEQNSNQVWAHL